MLPIEQVQLVLLTIIAVNTSIITASLLIWLKNNSALHKDIKESFKRISFIRQNKTKKTQVILKNNKK